MVVLVAVYVIAAKVGLSLSVAHGNATPVWAPTGIALAALVLFGRRLWPGVLVGAFIANATTDVALWTAGLIAVGNTAEALVGATLLDRMGFRPALDRGRDVFGLVACAAIAPVVSASVGVGAVVAAGNASDFWFHWRIWWVGDAMGALLIAPLVFTWTALRDRRTDGSLLEVAGIAAGLLVVGGLVFSNEPPAASFLVFPLIVWATLRFGQRGATLSIVGATAFGISAILGGARPFGGATETESVALLQGLMSLVAISSLLIAASISERERAEWSARADADLLARREAQLAEAQKVARMGSWEWDMRAGVVTWSDQMFEIHGYEPGSFEVTFDKALERVLPEDRVAIEANTKGAMATGEDGSLPGIEYRIELADGSRRILRGEGRFVFENGEPVQMIGTVQDVTELRTAQENETRLREIERSHQQALELNDEIVQRLAVAKLALELGHPEEAAAAIDEVMTSTRGIVGDLMSRNGQSRAGGFRRSKPGKSAP